MRKTIMVVDDDPRIRYLISLYMEYEGFKVIEAENGAESLKKFNEENIDLIILDIMMPKVDGLDVCKKLRQNNSYVHILFLTAKSEEIDKLIGYELGADDYVTKPFSPKVLTAKVKAILNRQDINAQEVKGSIKIQGIEINELYHVVTIDREEINLSTKEFNILLLLIKNKGIALSRETIVNKIWGYDYDGDFRAVDSHIQRIREKLKHKAYLISTVIGIGYKFEVKNDKK